MGDGLLILVIILIFFFLHLPILSLWYLPPVQPESCQMSLLRANEPLADGSAHCGTGCVRW